MDAPILPGGTGQRHLLIPAMPVPNGPLHLGHVSGPYLRLDMLARHLRRRGDRAAIVCGTDAYDSYLPLRAREEGVSPVDLARRCHARIAESLRALDIAVEALLDPLAPEWAAPYRAAHEEVMRGLRAAGALESVPERLPYSRVRSRFVTGGDLVGRCPACLAPAAGFFCEDCGAHFQPSALLDPRPRWGEEPLASRRITNAFLRVRDPRGLAAQWAGARVPDRFRGIAGRYLDREGPRVRLTGPESWGLPWTAAPEGEARSLFGHGLLFAYCDLCGEAYARRTGSGNPFRTETGVITVNGFGVDNTVSHLVGIQAVALALPDRRPFDRFLINDFYLLEGEKFSTSRGHAVWAADLVERTPVSAAALVRRLRAALRRQEDGLAYATFDPRPVAEEFLRWQEAAEPIRTADQAYWWLKGFALLGEPVMPGLAGEIWRALGGEGAPTYAAALAPTRPLPAPAVTPFAPVERGDLASCLPETVSGAPSEG